MNLRQYMSPVVAVEVLAISALVYVMVMLLLQACNPIQTVTDGPVLEKTNMAPVESPKPEYTVDTIEIPGLHMPDVELSVVTFKYCRFVVVKSKDGSVDVEELNKW